MKDLKIALITAAALIFGLSAEAKQTTYYTMLSTNGQVNKRECNMEGNQIVNGKLFGSGSQCRKGRPYTARYCPWGVGNRNNCIIPCMHGAGHKSVQGKRVSVKGFVCPWGPLKGKWINKVTIADVGGMVGKGHTDVFTGICIKKKSDNCVQYAPETTMAKYGKNQEKVLQQLASVIDSQYPGNGSTWLASLTGGGGANGPAVVATAGVAMPPMILNPSTVPLPVRRPSPPLPVRKPAPAAPMSYSSSSAYSSDLWLDGADGVR